MRGGGRGEKPSSVSRSSSSIFSAGGCENGGTRGKKGGGKKKKKRKKDPDAQSAPATFSIFQPVGEPALTRKGGTCWPPVSSPSLSSLYYGRLLTCCPENNKKKKGKERGREKKYDRRCNVSSGVLVSAWMVEGGKGSSTYLFGCFFAPTSWKAQKRGGEKGGSPGAAY